MACPIFADFSIKIVSLNWFLQSEFSIQIQWFCTDKVNQIMLLTDVRHINFVYTVTYLRQSLRQIIH